MVKIREGLPLVDGQTTDTDSASITAQLAHVRNLPTDLIYRPLTRQFSHPIKTYLQPRPYQNLDKHQDGSCSIQESSQGGFHPLLNSQSKQVWHEDYNDQLYTRKLNSALDRSHTNRDIAPNSHTDDSIIDTNIASTVNAQLSIDVDAWLVKVAQRIGETHLTNLAKAVELIQQLDGHYHGKRSNTFATGIGMTDILTYMYQDEEALVAAMLYRSARHNVISVYEIEANFGQPIATLVAETLSMGKLSETIEKSTHLEDHFVNNQREQLSKIYSMLISVTNDVRAVMIKLAERTFAMRELSFSSEERQKRVAREVMTIYAPLAHRLGIAQIKWELEDLSFRYLAPRRYKEIAKLLAEKRSEREAYINRVQHLLKESLLQEGIQADVSGRVKHIYSIYRKMQLKNLSFDQLYDIRALRVMVKNKGECYHVLGIVHGLWRHIPEQFDDYITNPKANGYRSLHTAVIAEQKSLEVQIRTHDMHFEAELGMCAHVNYKEGGKSDSYLNQRIRSLRHLLSLNNDKHNQDKQKNALAKLHSDAETHQAEHIDELASPPTPNRLDELEEDDQLVDFEGFKRIYVFSRDGEIIELPKGATVLDCAYYIHTHIGNQAQAGRVNQRYVPLTYPLKTGEQVEIITKASREPNRDWLVPALGYITTSRARSKLRQWFNRLDRDKNIQVGQQMFTNELERLNIDPNTIDLNQLVSHFNVKGTDDILVSLVSGDIGLHQLTNQVSRLLNLEPEDELAFAPTIQPKSTGKIGDQDIYIEGLDNIEIHLAKCCSPVQGEPIAGFITQSRGVSIHNRGCVEYLRLIEREPAREIEAVWYSSSRRQPVAIHIEAYDRKGLLRDMTQIIDNEDINIRKVGSESSDDDIAHMTFHIEVSGLSQLSKLLAKLAQQHGVIFARRAVG